MTYLTAKKPDCIVLSVNIKKQSESSLNKNSQPIFIFVFIVFKHLKYEFPSPTAEKWIFSNER